MFGSRMMSAGGARAGGMPLYKYVGNRILTTVREPARRARPVASGTAATAPTASTRSPTSPSSRNSDDFDFDTEIILGLHEAGKTIVEVPIPTYYGDEICYVNGIALRQGRAVDVLRYRLHKLGFGTGEHGLRRRRLRAQADADTPRTACCCGGCRTGARRPGARRRLLRRALRRRCPAPWATTSSASTWSSTPGVGDRLDEFVEADLDGGLPAEAGGDFDVVVPADVLEHVVDPERAAGRGPRRASRRGGAVLVERPELRALVPAARVVAGRFDYDQRGHPRPRPRPVLHPPQLPTARGRRRADGPWRGVTGLPLEVAERGAAPGTGGSGLGDAVGRVDRFAARHWPTMFGYQYLYELGLD